MGNLHRYVRIGGCSMIKNTIKVIIILSMLAMLLGGTDAQTSTTDQETVTVTETETIYTDMTIGTITVYEPIIVTETQWNTTTVTDYIVFPVETEYITDVVTDTETETVTQEQTVTETQTEETPIAFITVILTISIFSIKRSMTNK